MSTRPRAEVSATAEPEMPAKKVAESTLLRASPPRKRPRIALAKSSRRCVMPPSPIRLPARRKQGIASRLKESRPLKICWEKMFRLVDGIEMAMVATPPTRIEKPIGTPMSISPKTEMRSTGIRVMRTSGAFGRWLAKRGVLATRLYFGMARRCAGTIGRITRIETSQYEKERDQGAADGDREDRPVHRDLESWRGAAGADEREAVAVPHQEAGGAQHDGIPQPQKHLPEGFRQGIDQHIHGNMTLPANQRAGAEHGDVDHQEARQLLGPAWRVVEYVATEDLVDQAPDQNHQHDREQRVQGALDGIRRAAQPQSPLRLDSLLDVLGHHSTLWNLSTHSVSSGNSAAIGATRSRKPSSSGDTMVTPASSKVRIYSISSSSICSDPHCIAACPSSIRIS